MVVKSPFLKGWGLLFFVLSSLMVDGNYEELIQNCWQRNMDKSAFFTACYAVEL